MYSIGALSKQFPLLDIDCLKLNLSYVYIKVAKELEVDYIQGYYYSRPLDKIVYKSFINDYSDQTV